MKTILSFGTQVLSDENYEALNRLILCLCRLDTVEKDYRFVLSLTESTLNEGNQIRILDRLQELQEEREKLSARAVDRATEAQAALHSLRGNEYLVRNYRISVDPMGAITHIDHFGITEVYQREEVLE